MTDPRLMGFWPRAAADLVLFVMVGLFMGFIRAYGVAAPAPGVRFAYWVACIVGGGVIGIAIDALIAERVRGLWARIAFTSLAMTPAVTLWVLAVGRALTGTPLNSAAYLELLPQVFVVCVPVMGLRALIWRSPRQVIETRTVIEPPLPEAEAAFRRRLSARRRNARLIAVEAEDHYVRVHTDAGSELVSLRFADALEELARVHGWRTHRSWWVAAEAVRGGSWRRGAGELRLEGGLTAPVSRTYVAALRAAGWL